MNRLRVSILQMDIAWENKQDNLRRLREKLEALRGATEIIVLPETFSTGFSMNTDTLAEPVTGNTITTLRQWASEYQIAIAGSYIACEENFVSSESNPLSYKNSTYYNRAFFLPPEGEAYFYDKRHLFRMGNETDNFTAGSRRIIISYRGWNILLLVCYDLRFPEQFRIMVDLGVQAFFVVSAWPEARLSHWRLFNQVRALENQCFLVSCNCTGTQNGSKLPGHSMTVAPDGTICMEADAQAGTFWSSVTFAEVEQARADFPALHDRVEIQNIISSIP